MIEKVEDILSKPFKNATVCGIGLVVDPFSIEARLILDILEQTINRCSMCDTVQPAVRVGIFHAYNHDSDGACSDYRGLCERHKDFGRFNGAWEW